MKLKHSVMVGMLGRIYDRFHEYQPASNLLRQLEMAKAVPGMSGIEIVYPNHFSELGINKTIAIVKDQGIKVSAVNLDVKRDKKWQFGSFTARDPLLRREAIKELKTALDIAAELGTDMVTCCPLIDGHNYNFEADYLKQWPWLVEGIREGTNYRTDVRLSLEYKLNKSRNYNILSDASRVLYLCEILNKPHLGITLDLGHALIAREAPAEVLCLVAQANRLLYIHLNDNDRGWDCGYDSGFDQFLGPC